MPDYRKRIRINGKVVSARFTKKKDADDWYNEMKRQKSFMTSGLSVSNYSKSPLVIDYARDWMKKRMKEYPMSTWYSDEQRLRDYWLPEIGSIPIDKVTAGQIKNVLRRLGESLSVGTVTRVKAVISKMFNDALNDDPPYISANPVSGIRFQTRRKGKAKPVTLTSPEEVLNYLASARSLSPLHFVTAALMLGAGLRKSESSALQWQDFDPSAGILMVRRHVEQVSLRVLPGTKAGEFAERAIPISQSLAVILSAYRKASIHKKPESFILSDANGEWIRPRRMHDMITEIGKAYGKKLKPHELRHTFGRIFVQLTGNQKAVQTMLGHTSSSTTDLYTELSGSQIKPFREALSQIFDLEKED